MTSNHNFLPKPRNKNIHYCKIYVQPTLQKIQLVHYTAAKGIGKTAFWYILNCEGSIPTEWSIGKGSSRKRHAKLTVSWKSD